MDMFMDKLAQKLNAQEIIRANTTAETEELNRLRSRVAEYNECLDKLAAMIEDGRAKLEGVSIENTDLKARVEGIQSSVDALEEAVAGNSGDIKGLAKDVETLLKESLQEISAMQFGIQAIVASSDENVHKECVKVYRNVQAVVVEEGTKQAENLAQVSAKVDAAKSKAGVALGISIVTMVLVLSSVVMQVLELLNISLF